MRRVTWTPRPGLRHDILRLIDQGVSFRETARQLSCSVSTVQYHALRRQDLSVKRTGPRSPFDWPKVQAFHDAGATAAQCQAHFGFSQTTWYKAIERGQIKRAVTVSPVGVRSDSARAHRVKKREERLRAREMKQAKETQEEKPKVKRQSREEWVKSLPTGPLGSWGRKG